MHKQATSPPETAQDFRERVEELNAEHGADWAGQYGPGSFGCHELLDRTAFVAGLVDDLIHAHPSCALHEDWFGLADQAVSALNELYQRVGAAHLGDQAGPVGGAEVNPPEDH